MENELACLPVAILDCQTTGATPAIGSLLEIAWTILPSGIEEYEPNIHSHLVLLPDGESIPFRVSRMTGISAEMCRDGLDHYELAGLLRAALGNTLPIAHYAIFEQRWIDHLFSVCLPDEEIPQIICTREIARRLYPRLPRKGIRAVAGYLGYSMDEKKRAADHVRATALIWARLVSELGGKGIMTLSQLHDFLSEPPSPGKGSWSYPIPRETRLSLPDTPGVYCLLSKERKVLYAGKGTSLRRRVNSYFTRRKADEKTLELVSQVHDVSIEECETPLEAALLEFGTIRRFDPPYNIALRGRGSGIVFLSRDLSSVSSAPGNDFVWGPVPDNSQALLINKLLSTVNDGGTIPAKLLGLEYRPLEEGALESGFSMFRNELQISSPVSSSNLLSAGLALWLRRIDEKKSEHEENDEDSDPVITIDEEGVKRHLEWLLAAGVRDLRRGAWFCQLGWLSLLWKPSISDSNRCAVFSAGRMVSSTWLNKKEPPSPEPVSRLERQLQIDAGVYDLLGVLDAEVRRITVEGSLIAVQTTGGNVLERRQLKGLYRFI
ncbi:MAG: GIY-YIG nuclease family protein [Candidatus Aegiribacteria sp.]|nr:GIY-YIG nuclease family protein [Candidatus Aegiribacteria sp.]